MFSFKSRYKDKNPLESIKVARDIIGELGYIVKEEWFNPVDGLFSVNLTILIQQYILMEREVDMNMHWLAVMES